MVDLNNSLQIQTDERPMSRLDGYEKIRTVGKGAFGTANLYMRHGDQKMVIFKEINMHELTAAERLLALNEVKVLSLMSHPNIVSYYDSFEANGILMIEMEYADGGTLDQFLAHRTQAIAEVEILFIFRQTVAALHHMHSNNILHRDLKTANIFLTKDGHVKVGDFGISKMLTTRRNGAHTVLGTPYYISPEMCEGKPYDEKSDIWALGCILYEMACLQKTFEGSNLPALVNKIVKGQFAPIRGNYSPLFKLLVKDILQKEPEFRPSAEEILYQRLPELMSQFQVEPQKDSEELNYSEDNPARRNSQLEEKTLNLVQTDGSASVVYRVEVKEGNQIGLTAAALPVRCRVQDIAVSDSHCLVLTSDLLVYGWGSNDFGQLGLGSHNSRVSTPTCIDQFRGKSIVKISAGVGFSVFVSESGILMTCGQGDFGCLGHGDRTSISSPKIVEKLLSVDISDISCGPSHVAAVTGNGSVFTWGRGLSGCLGLGTTLETCTPTEVKVPAQHVIVGCHCGPDATILLSDTGKVLACGDNRFNRLGLSSSLFSTQKSEGSTFTRFKQVGGFKQRIIEASIGLDHCAFLTENGTVIITGDNSYAQKGTGSSKSAAAFSTPRLFEQRPALSIQCGMYFTLAATVDNVLYCWGTLDSNDTRHVTFLEPKETLALYASASQISRGEILHIFKVVNSQNSSWMVVNTTAPAPTTRQPNSDIKISATLAKTRFETTSFRQPPPTDVKKETSFGEGTALLRKLLEELQIGAK